VLPVAVTLVRLRLVAEAPAVPLKPSKQTAPPKPSANLPLTVPPDVELPPVAVLLVNVTFEPVMCDPSAPYRAPPRAEPPRVGPLPPRALLPSKVTLFSATLLAKMAARPPPTPSPPSPLVEPAPWTLLPLKVTLVMVLVGLVCRAPMLMIMPPPKAVSVLPVVCGPPKPFWITKPLSERAVSRELATTATPRTWPPPSMTDCPLWAVNAAFQPPEMVSCWSTTPTTDLNPRLLASLGWVLLV